MPSDERVQIIRGVELCTQARGNPADPPVLLVMGAMASMVWWPDELCDRLAASGRYVIRYDHRDTGRSFSYPPGSPGYSFEDLADDAVGVLNAHRIESAHLVGMSLGGLIGQMLALKSPSRVRTLTAISSEPLVAGDKPEGEVDPQVLAHHAKGGELDWTDHEQVADYMASGWKLLSGPDRPFEEPLIRLMALREARRARSPQSAINHALLKGGEQWMGRLGEIRTPTVVIHGTHDKVLRFAGAQALAKGITGARLIALEGAGHELHRMDWDTIVTAVVRHTAQWEETARVSKG
jgi:pimeloyl-ACP methyl ester carboxylesterase